MKQKPHRLRSKTPLVTQDKFLLSDPLPSVIEFVSSLPDSPKNTYLKEKYLAKFVSSDTLSPKERRDKALAKWMSIETANLATNERLLSAQPHEVIYGTVTHEKFVEWVRAFIARVIGDTVPLSALFGSFSGGASTGRSRSDAHPAQKIIGKADITQSARQWFDLVLTECPAWANAYDETYGGLPLRVVRGSKFFTVPKNADIDRVACKEPDINMYLQKGAGDFIRRRLKRFGIHLNDQNRNKDLARRGSLTGALATLDLSSASDTITVGLIETLLPISWHVYLDDIRSHWIEVDSEWHYCEMFSSMGNGFTFELESLIFFAIAKGVAYFGGHQGIVSVYGDDIIVPTAAYGQLVRALSYFGFTVNTEKSFSDGPFRESCGGHYWDGIDITPFYVRGPIRTVTDLIHFLNQFRLWAGRGERLFLSEEAWPLWERLSQDVPRIFWGGSLESAGRSQLVSPHLPRKRLVTVNVKLRLPSYGSYLSALLSKSGPGKRAPAIPKGLTPDSGLKLVTSSVCRVKPANNQGWHDCGMYFLEEVNRGDALT